MRLNPPTSIVWWLSLFLCVVSAWLALRVVSVPTLSPYLLDGNSWIGSHADRNEGQRTVEQRVVTTRFHEGDGEKPFLEACLVIEGTWGRAVCTTYQAKHRNRFRNILEFHQSPFVQMQAGLDPFGRGRSHEDVAVFGCGSDASR